MSTLDVIAQEARRHRTVVIDAFELNGSRETREIEPYSLRRRRRGVLLYFFCRKRGGWRCLYVANIVRAQATGRPFVPRAAIEL